MMIKKLDMILAASYNAKNKSQVKILNEEDLKFLLLTDYSSAAEKIKNGYEIYRGVSRGNTKPLMEVVPGIRTSENTSNIYTLLFSEVLPSWSKYPKRNRSVICTNEIEKAMDYSSTPENIYLVLPKNNANMGICNTSDIWDAINLTYDSPGIPREYRLEIYDLPTFNEVLAYLLDYALNINHPESFFYSGNGKEVIKMLDALDDYVDKEDEENITEMIEEYDDIYSDTATQKAAMCMLLAIKKSGKTSLGFLNDFLNPHKSGIELTTIEEYGPHATQYQEIWTDSPCLMVSLTYRYVLDEFLGIKDEEKYFIE